MIELDELAADASACTACALCETRNSVVFGTGSHSADLVFVGEAPGRNEDEQGVPFVGAAGNLLDRLCSDVGIVREQVYICNILKCRPPGNRDPEPGEIASCTPYLDRQLELLDPLVVVSLGAFATRYLLDRQVGVTRVRGRRFRWRNDATLIPTLHPAAVLRGGASKLQDAREDFAVIRATIDKARTYRAKNRAASAGAATGADAPERVDAEIDLRETVVATSDTAADDAGQLGLF